MAQCTRIRNFDYSGPLTVQTVPPSAERQEAAIQGLPCCSGSDLLMMPACPPVLCRAWVSAIFHELCCHTSVVSLSPIHAVSNPPFALCSCGRYPAVCGQHSAGSSSGCVSCWTSLTATRPEGPELGTWSFTCWPLGHFRSLDAGGSRVDVSRSVSFM